jgi:TolA-binding protein
MFKWWNILALTLLTGLVSNCAVFWSSEPEKSPKPSDTDAAEKAVSKSDKEIPASSAAEQAKATSEAQTAQITEQISLAQARTVERMAEIEAELRQQKEQIKLLEQGLLTGIAPDDLKRSSGKKIDKASQHASNVHSEVDENIDVALGVVTSSPLSQPVLDSDLLAKANGDGENPDLKLTNMGQFESLLAKAKGKYQSSDFSGSLADFADLSRRYGENFQEGVLRFWLGKCYLGLKEYATARQEFEAYISRAPKSSQVAEARLELSRVLLKLGLNERARNELKKVISDFEGQEAAEVAAHELGTLQGAL